MIFFDIAGKRYNKAQATRIASSIVAKYNLGEELDEKDAEIAKSLYELRFGYPPESDFKFFIDSDGYGYKCFHHIDNNGNVDHFSFRKALSKKPTISKRNILTAFRVAVDEQVNPYRRKGYHVDHIVPFHVLLSDFLRDKGLSLSDIKIEENCSDIRYGVYLLVDESLRHEWESYHKKHARLRTVTKEENLRKGGQEDLPLYLYRRKRNETYDPQYLHDCP